MILILSSFLIGVTGAWMVMKYGSMMGAIDMPDSRSSHHEGTPKGGGFGILVAFVFFSLILKIPIFIWLPGVVISLVSFWGGDKHLWSVKKKTFYPFWVQLVFYNLFFIFKTSCSGQLYLFDTYLRIHCRDCKFL